MQTDASTWHLILLVLALGIAFAFEFVNGFHDAANAVATVIYTRSLRPWTAVILSGFFNLVGVYLGGIAVAVSILKILPVELLASSGSGAGLSMVLALLLAAIIWNLGTWYLGLPASSSHTLIGAIVGVGIANSLMPGHVFGTGVNWHKVGEIGLSLVCSPVIGLMAAGVLLLLMRRFLPSPELHRPADEAQAPPRWIRAILVGTCSGVSLAHGSNDGQKGVGLVMLILIGILPADFALDTYQDQATLARTVAVAEEMEKLTRAGYGEEIGTAPESTIDSVLGDLAAIRSALENRRSVREIPAEERWDVRTRILRVDSSLAVLQDSQPGRLSPRELDTLRRDRRALREAVDYAPTWLVIAVALALGVGTTVGWKRIVVTVGEKIGKVPMSYSQGASAEVVAATTIGVSGWLGLPVSTTHVLSSGVAGTMLVGKSGLQRSTVRNIAIAWVLTLPAATALAGGLFLLFRAMLPNPMDARALPVDATASAHDREATPPVRVVAADALRLQGAHSLGVRVAPELAEAFLVKKRATAITRRAGDDAYGWLVSGQLPGDSRPRLIEIAAGGSAAMFQSLAAGAGDVGMASRRATPAEVAQIATAGLGDIASPAHEHVLGVDGMPVIVHPTNPVSSLGVEDVARIFSGQVTAWAMLGKGEGRITLYARNERSSSFDVFKALVLRELPLAPTAKRFVEAGALADAVTDDVHGIGFASMSSMRRAKVVAVGGTGVPAIPPTALSVSAEEYPLSRRLYLYTTSATSNPLATEFVEFALSPEGQKIIAAAGFVDLGVRVGGGRACDERCPPRYAALTERGRRLAPLFRFRPGTTEFDSRAQRDIDRVADFVRRDSPSTVALAGFSERVGLSVDRARKVAEELRARGIRVDAAEGFGGAVPLVSKDVSGAEERNERVEVWLASR